MALCISETAHYSDQTSGILEFSNDMQAYAREGIILVWMPGKSKIHIFNRSDLERDRIKNLNFGEDTKKTIDFEGLHGLVDYSTAAETEIYKFQALLNLPERKSSLSYHLDSNSIIYYIESACGVSLTLGFILGHLVKQLVETYLSMYYHGNRIGQISMKESSSEVALKLLFRKLLKTYIQPLTEQDQKLRNSQDKSCVTSAA